MRDGKSNLSLSCMNINVFHRGVTILNYNFRMCVSLCVCLCARNRHPNHAHYGDEPVAGDSIGLGYGQRLNFIFETHFLVLLRQNRPYDNVGTIGKTECML